MNLKEEINKVKGTGNFCNCMDYEDAIRIAEEYAKEKAWESRKFAMIEHGHWPPDWPEYENKQREIFEKWWEENK